MQVKKFEAKSIKEALQMVKQELGPEAIIISAKDNKKSFGLAGQGSVEVTAAISEKSLQKKQFTENRMTTNDKEKFRTQSAGMQKKFIDSKVNKYQQRAQANLNARNGSGGLDTQEESAPRQRPVPRPPTGRRYIDIADEDERINSQVMGKSVEDVLESLMVQNQRPDSFEESPRQSVNPPMSTYNGASTEDVGSLKAEVQQLREMLGLMSRNGVKSPTQHPGAEFGLSFELSHQFEKLQTAGVDSRYIVEVLEKAERELTLVDKKKKSLIDAWVARFIMSNTEVVENWSTPDTKLQLFMGPSGQGKTTSLVKVASHFVLNEKKRVAVLTADHFKVGGIEQLKIFCQILNVPLEPVKHSIEFKKLLAKYSSYDVILVDYPGLALKNITEIDQLRALMPHRDLNYQCHLVMGCTTKELDAYEIAQRYSVAQFDDVIITRVDESFTHGLLYNIQRKTEKPLYGFGIGTRIPEDLEIATKERVLDLIYKITKNSF